MIKLFSKQTLNPSACFRAVSCAVFSLGLALFPIICRAQEDNRSLMIKAAYVYNIVNFVAWPDPPAPGSTPLTIYLLGKCPFENLFDPIKGRNINGRTLKIEKISATEKIIPGNVVFICQSEKKRLETILKSLNGCKVLTLSDISDFTDHGGMIGLHEKQNRIKLSVNIRNVRKEGLSISSKLLELCEIKNP